MPSATHQTPCQSSPLSVDFAEPRKRGTFERFAFDEEYLARLASGDFETERHFTEYFGQLLLIKLRSRLRCPQAVADARQETFVRVFAAIRRKGTILHPERLGGYVNAVCENVLSEFFRSGQRLSQLPENAPEPIDQGKSAESELITEERKQQVKETLAQLSGPDRKLLRGLFLEERDRDELCGELKIDRDYLRVKVHRALGRFRNCYQNKQLVQTAGARS